MTYIYCNDDMTHTLLREIVYQNHWMIFCLFTIVGILTIMVFKQGTK